MTTPRVISRDTTATELDADYKWGFTIDIDSDLAPKGLSEDVVRLISAKKQKNRSGCWIGASRQNFRHWERLKYEEPRMSFAWEPEWMLDWRLKAFRHWEPRRAGLGQHPPRAH